MGWRFVAYDRWNTTKGMMLLVCAVGILQVSELSGFEYASPTGNVNFGFSHQFICQFLFAVARSLR